MENQKFKLLELTSNIVSAYISKNNVEIENLQKIIQEVYRSLKKVHDGIQNYKLTGPLQPAVSIEESYNDDYVICLEDGKKLQMLKRHLNTVYNMTPEQYKERWGLPADYPMVAPNYAQKRSEIAKQTGLGVTKRKKTKVEMAATS